jgi:hypothetical protein
LLNVIVNVNVWVLLEELSEPRNRYLILIWVLQFIN